MLLLALILIVVGIILMVAGLAPPAHTIGVVCLILGVVLLIVALVGSNADLDLDALVPLPALLAGRLGARRAREILRD
jgi:hypothetical protein